MKIWAKKNDDEKKKRTEKKIAPSSEQRHSDCFRARKLAREFSLSI